MNNEYTELSQLFSEYYETNNNKGILSICDRLAELYELVEGKSACQIYHTAFISLTEIEPDELGITETEYYLLRAYYEGLADDCFLCRDPKRIEHEMIKDFITPGACRLNFDQQDLKVILYDYLHLCSVDINGNEFFSRLDYILNYCLRHIHVDRQKLVSIILVKGGDKNEILRMFSDSALRADGIKCLYAHNDELVPAPSVRIYFFKESVEQNKAWRKKLDDTLQAREQNIKEVLEHFNFESN